ncbi:hypothetical protein BC834DRAFT_390316 [Gloeopeniophorella convolvens]|nr:hypothetical protein BC834DRAFT_390316 [Gloeopeniophorella convolvens]
MPILTPLSDHPLALCVFSKDDAFKAKVFDSTQSGSCIANETLMHGTGWCLLVPDQPRLTAFPLSSEAEGILFGGIGASGSGFYSSG